MNSANSRSTILQFAVGTLVLTLVLRTWLVMGLVEPVLVAGSSMVPTLRGPHDSIICEKCGQSFDVGAEFATTRIECLACGFAENTAEGLPVQRGDRLIVDRTAFQWRQPQRWEVVVFHSPADSQLTVKRIVGMPGETVELRSGDVCINGQAAKKSLDQMRAVRQLIHAETNVVRRWHGENWHWSDGAWQIATNDHDWHWLRYLHRNGKPITDDTAYNAGLTRRLFPVRDFCFSANICAEGEGKLAVRFDNGREQFEWEGDLRGDVLLEVFAFDRRCQVFLNGDLALTEKFDSSAHIVGCVSPFAIGSKNLAVALSHLRIYRDIYHASQSEELGVARPMTPIVLGANEIIVLGDNVPVSLDSRHWGPVPLRLLVGRPLLVR